MDKLDLLNRNLDAFYASHVAKPFEIAGIHGLPAIALPNDWRVPPETIIELRKRRELADRLGLIGA